LVIEYAVQNIFLIKQIANMGVRLMKTRVIAGMFLMFIGNLIAGEYTVDGFCRGERSVPQASNPIIEAPNKGTLPKTTVDEKLKPGELFYRPCFGSNEYCIYKGTFAPNVFQQELFIFPIPQGMNLSRMLGLKFYKTDKIRNSDDDIRAMYFDNANVYTEYLQTIYWNDNGTWQTLTGVSIKEKNGQAKLTGDLQITFVPSDAEIYVDQEKQNPQNPGKIYIARLPHGEHLISVRKYGFQSIEKALTVKPGGIITSDSIVLSSAFGTVVIESEPIGAQVKMYNLKKGQDSNYGGVTPWTQSYLEPGQYVVELSWHEDLYLPSKDTITIRMNETTKPPKKTLTPDFGSLEIISSPPGAAVTVNGKNCDQPAPLTISRIKTGTVTVTATLEMYKTATKTMIINRGETEKIILALQPNFATLDLKEIAPGFGYIVDGESVPAGQKRVTSAKHNIKFDGREMYQSLDTTITIESGSQITLGKECVRLVGDIKIVPTPLDADVFLDDKKIGTGPTVKEKVPTGPHVVSAKKSGYTLTKADVFIKEGEIEEINLTLPQIPDRDGDGVEDDKDPCPDDPGTVNGCKSTETVDLLIKSDPAEATILENRKIIGITPIRLTMFEGKHSLMFYHTDYKDTTIELDVLKESSHKINIELTPTDEMLKQITAQKQARQDSIAHAKSYKKRASMRTRQITFGCLGLLLGGAGYYFNTRYDKTYDDYLAVKDPNVAVSKWQIVDKNRNYRNWLYIGAGVFGGLCTISFVF
jgi:hypothetical protein